MSESAAPASGPPPVAGATTIRDAMTRVSAGSSEYTALEQQLEGMYRRAHGEAVPAAAVGAGTGARYEEPPAQVLAKATAGETSERPAVFDEPHATPQTAAELNAVPLPEGLDPEKNQAINRAAEREGLTRFVLEGRRVLSRAAQGPPVDPVATLRVLRGRWGPAFDSKLEAAHLALDALPSDVRADLERRELDMHPAVMDYLARVGEALMDPRTPGGERRLRAKYADRTGG